MAYQRRPTSCAGQYPRLKSVYSVSIQSSLRACSYSRRPPYLKQRSRHSKSLPIKDDQSIGTFPFTFNLNPQNLTPYRSSRRPHSVRAQKVSLASSRTNHSIRPPRAEKTKPQSSCTSFRMATHLLIQPKRQGRCYNLMGPANSRRGTFLMADMRFRRREHCILRRSVSVAQL